MTYLPSQPSWFLRPRSDRDPATGQRASIALLDHHQHCHTAYQLYTGGLLSRSACDLTNFALEIRPYL